MGGVRGHVVYMWGCKALEIQRHTVATTADFTYVGDLQQYVLHVQSWTALLTCLAWAGDSIKRLQAHPHETKNKIKPPHTHTRAGMYDA